ncbi:hypothetical protein J6524_04855 [Bradyrhizobium sp. WSM 1738]|nr:hypothetical protein [Bradyrhizobium hereditatis]
MLNAHTVNATFVAASTILTLADKPVAATAFFVAAVAGVIWAGGTALLRQR